MQSWEMSRNCSLYSIIRRILKTGVGIGEDIRKVLQYLVVDEVHGVVDITYLSATR